jgi:hypothetical protein
MLLILDCTKIPRETPKFGENKHDISSWGQLQKFDVKMEDITARYKIKKDRLRAVSEEQNEI